ncbi:hypothetical protein CHUAL_006831 [Chamberlinius hualienensis]
MDEEIKAKLKTKLLKRTGRGGGGCINEGECYETDQGKVFVKRNSKSEARQMFDGEYESLKAILATDTVRVPKPFLVVDNPAGGAALVMEYVEMSTLNRHSVKLGQQLAMMHLHNEKMELDAEKNETRVGNRGEWVTTFGFHSVTCCGYIAQDNTWSQDWMEFYTKQKLKFQVDLVEQKYGDRDLRELWPELVRKIPEFFREIKVKPALLHGDLWGGNAAETCEGPIIFDPATFYGHSEFDLAIAKMFGGFGNSFFKAYHEVLPKQPGFDLRHQLYQLFHYLNHWNHFGSGYKSSSMNIIRRLVA